MSSYHSWIGGGHEGGDIIIVTPPRTALANFVPILDKIRSQWPVQTYRKLWFANSGSLRELWLFPPKKGDNQHTHTHKPSGKNFIVLCAVLMLSWSCQPASARKETIRRTHTNLWSWGRDVEQNLSQTQIYLGLDFAIAMLPFVAVSSDESRIAVHLQFNSPASLFCTGVNLSNILNCETQLCMMSLILPLFGASPGVIIMPSDEWHKLSRDLCRISGVDCSASVGGRTVG